MNYNNNGELSPDEMTDFDLFFTPTKREGWVNIYEGKNNTRTLGCLFSNEEEANKHKLNEYTSGYIKTIKIEWKE